MSRRLAWALFGLTIGADPRRGRARRGRARPLARLPVTRESMLFIVAVADGAALLYGTVGLLIARREPRNAIGWIFLGSAVTLAAMAVAYCYADLGALRRRGLGAARVWAGWFANWSFIPPVFMAPCFVAQLFPNGRPLPGRWRWVLWVSAAFAVEALLATALDPGRMEPYPDRTNPVGIDGAAGDVVSVLNTVGRASARRRSCSRRSLRSSSASGARAAIERQQISG